MGAVTPSGKVLARAMARYVDPDTPGPVIELGSGTGAVTKALVTRRRSVAAGAGRIQSDVLPAAAHPLSGRDRDPGRRLSHRSTARRAAEEPAAAVVSGLPLTTKPFKQRIQLIDEAFDLMAPGAPFVQFTYAMVTPIPKRPEVVGAGLRADLAEYAAGARVGVSEELI